MFFKEKVELIAGGIILPIMVLIQRSVMAISWLDGMEELC